jgi:hypothetical protein
MTFLLETVSPNAKPYGKAKAAGQHFRHAAQGRSRR